MCRESGGRGLGAEYGDDGEYGMCTAQAELGVRTGPHGLHEGTLTKCSPLRLTAAAAMSCMQTGPRAPDPGGGPRAGVSGRQGLAIYWALSV